MTALYILIGPVALFAAFAFGHCVGWKSSLEKLNGTERRIAELNKCNVTLRSDLDVELAARADNQSRLVQIEFQRDRLLEKLTLQISANKERIETIRKLEDKLLKVQEIVCPEIAKVQNITV